MLSEVDRTSDATQRDLSRRVGIALGLTNVLLRSLAQKGYVRVTQAGWKRWLYTLTPAGFSRKIRLTVAYIDRTLEHYQNVRQSLRDQLEPLSLHEESRVAIYGTGMFAELIYLGLREMRIEEIDIFGSDGTVGSMFLGMPVQDVAGLRPELYDRVVIAILQHGETNDMELPDLGLAPGKIVTLFTEGNQAVVGRLNARSNDVENTWEGS